MKRREFIALGGIAVAAAWPLAARAAPGRARVGYLSISSADFDAANLATFRDGLLKLGYVEGRSVDIDYRYSDGDAAALDRLAQELLQLKPDVMLANAISPVRALKRAAPNIPIVCPGFGDSFVPSLAASFAHPGGSVTGIATIVEGLSGKVIELVRDAIPDAGAVGFLANPTGASTAENERQVQAAALAHGIKVQIESVKAPGDIDEAFAHLSAAPVQAVIVPANGLLNAQLKQLVALQVKLRLPLFFTQRAEVEAGGLASYGIDSTGNYRRAAAYVDKIIKGAAPGDLPIEFPTKVELVINLKTARALGLQLPTALLNRADDVIE
jgi:putative tryptophan/tyrosine transport system substrate-binding protein